MHLRNSYILEYGGVSEHNFPLISYSNQKFKMLEGYCN